MFQQFKTQNLGKQFSKLSNSEIDTIYSLKIVPIQKNFMLCWDSLNNEERISMGESLANWQRIVNESYLKTLAKSHVINDSTTATTKEATTTTIIFESEIYFLKKTQLLILERCSRVDGGFKKNTRLLLKSFTYFVGVIECLQVINDKGTHWSQFTLFGNQALSAIFRMAVYVHQNTRLDFTSSICLPPTYFIESDKPVPEIEPLRQYLNVLFFQLNKQLKLNKTLKAELKLYRLILKCLIRLVDLIWLADLSEDNMSMKVGRCVSVYASEFSKQIRLIREYLIQMNESK